MGLSEQLIITLVDKALIGLLVVVVAFGLNRALENFKHDLGLAATRHELTLQSQIEFKERQIAEFYGPIYALLKLIRPLDDLWTQKRVSDVEEGVVKAIRDSNQRIVEIILNKSHLIRGNTIPESYTRFLTHVAVWNAFIDASHADWKAYRALPEAQYSMAFEEEIFRTTEALKRELDTLYQQYGLRENWREEYRR